MGLPATDSFTDTNGVQLTSHSSDWTLNAGDLDVQSNALAPDDAGDSMAHWNADAFDDDQYAQATVVAISGSVWIGVSVRAHASAHTGYCYSGDDDEREISKFVAGSYTSISYYGSGGFSVNDDIRIEAESTTITPVLNASTDTNVGAQTDAAISSGSAGVCGYSDSEDSRIDDWEGGDLGGGGGISIPVVMHHFRNMRA
jgi:hypothetical protein